jgi:hypothetical protein
MTTFVSVKCLYAWYTRTLEGESHVVIGIVGDGRADAVVACDGDA